jgi:hypothetical protein
MITGSASMTTTPKSGVMSIGMIIGINTKMEVSSGIPPGGICTGVRMGKFAGSILNKKYS